MTQDRKLDLRPKDKEFIRIFTETGDIRSATQEVYGDGALKLLPNEALRKGKKILSKEKILKGVLKVWNSVGMTLDATAKVHWGILTSKTAKKSDVLKAIEMVYKGHKVWNDDSLKDRGGRDDTLHIFIEQREARGLPVPAVVKNAVTAEVIPQPEEP